MPNGKKTKDFISSSATQMEQDESLVLNWDLFIGVGLEDGQRVSMNDRETPTRGRQLTILEQLLGNVGRGQLPRTDEDVPGQQRRE